MKSKRAPWHTAKTGQGWHIAGHRYMNIVPGQQVIHVKDKSLTCFVVCGLCHFALLYRRSLATHCSKSLPKPSWKRDLSFQVVLS